jgi:hypothetical protein
VPPPVYAPGDLTSTVLPPTGRRARSRFQRARHTAGRAEVLSQRLSMTMRTTTINRFRSAFGGEILAPSYDAWATECGCSRSTGRRTTWNWSNSESVPSGVMLQTYRPAGRATFGNAGE